MRRVSVCIPVLNRYDLLSDLLRSLEHSTVAVVAYVIDNGRDAERLEGAVKGVSLPIVSYTPTQSMGVAESWNWFIENAPEERVIVNDDVTFAPDSLARLTAADADLVWADGCGFSCFVIRNSCVDAVGLFDETISPGYGYFEDEDYLQRIDGKGTLPPRVRCANVDAGVGHLGSQTLSAYTPEEVREHRRLFRIAQMNYATKWPHERTWHQPIEATA